MPVYQTSELIEKLQQQTEQFLQKAVSEWQVTAPNKLLRQPGQNQWSAAQCLEHLNSYGLYYLPEIEKAIERAMYKNSRPATEFKAGVIGNYFTKMMLPKDGKQMKMKAPKNHSPVADLDAARVVSGFIDQQEKMLQLLEKSREIDLNEVKIPISIARFIKLKLGDVFMFLIAHNYRHILQAERALGKKAGLRFEVKELITVPM